LHALALPPPRLETRAARAALQRLPAVIASAAASSDS
jgi:hypothetical protein